MQFIMRFFHALSYGHFKQTSPIGDFPTLDRLSGCFYEGHDCGVVLMGTIAAVERTTDRVTLYNENGEIVFSITGGWTCWYMESNCIYVYIPTVGTYVIYDVRP